MIIRRYQSQDMDSMKRLFVERDIHFDEEMFVWKKQAPAVYSWVALLGDEIAGHYCILEMPMWPGIRTGFAIDAIFSKQAGTIPNISRVINHALAEIKEQGFDLVIGVPNERMAPVKRLLGWKPAPPYIWKVSNGIESLQEKYPSALQISSGDYEQWRWQMCPRKYLQSENGTIATAADRAAVDRPPMLMRFDRNVWHMINRRYRFLYLEQLSGEFQSNESSVQPLYVSISNVNKTLVWPELWPLETVEGVTLGW